VAGAPVVQWTEDGEARSALWRSERGAPPPAKIVVADDRMRADDAYGLAAQGVGLLWRGDFQNARQLMTAMAKRASPAPSAKAGDAGPALFNRARQVRAQRARTLGALLIPLEADYAIPLRRAPDVADACREAYGPAERASLVSMRELLGLIGAHEWRRNGIEIPAVRGSIHPHYGVFAPVRSEYIDLVAKAPLPAVAKAKSLAFDVGTGTGVLAAILARRGIARVVATDLDPRALACARENVERLGLAQRIDVVQADLFPEGRAAVIVCNPPWVPARPSSPLEHGIYDPDSRMLRGFLDGLAAHLEPGGEGWLVLSDLAEHLGLRTREQLLGWIAQANLAVVNHMDVRPRHPKAADASDPLHAARKAEVTSLWRLAAR
jgi:2-polyprenyl-3-methyl-5-hydroxy-6-metoxy-1,4-benzoquinol methylase